MRSEVSELAYKQMEDSVQYFVTFVLHALVVMGAIIVKELTVLFDFISTFGNTFLMLVIPSLFLILSQNYFPSGKRQLGKLEGKTLRVLAYIVIAIGVVIFALGMYVCVARVIEGG